MGQRNSPQSKGSFFTKETIIIAGLSGVLRKESVSINLQKDGTKK